jgi:tetratricopeptide (TPR) repeat protein
MSSTYIDTVVNDNFADLVIDRFKVMNIHNNTKIALIRSARIFSSVLHFLLLGDNSSYQHFHTSFQKFKGQPDKQNLKNIISSMFFDQIYQNILYDFRTAPVSYISKKGILGYMHRFEIKLGSESDLLLAIGGKIHNYFVNMKIGQEITAGEILNPVDIGSNIRHGNHLVSIGEYEYAISIFDIVIKNSRDPELLSIAWNNKAQCFRMLRQHRRELQYINKALKYKKKPEFFSNKILCLETLGRNDEANQVRKQFAEL